MDVNEHERLFTITLKTHNIYKLKVEGV